MELKRIKVYSKDKTRGRHFLSRYQNKILYLNKLLREYIYENALGYMTIYQCEFTGNYYAQFIQQKVDGCLRIKGEDTKTYVSGLNDLVEDLTGDRDFIGRIYLDPVKRQGEDFFKICLK